MPTSVGEAYEFLRLVGEQQRRAGDFRAPFTDVYAIITRRVRDAVNDNAAPRFQEPQFISRLAGRFCSLYLAALSRSAAGATEPIDAWAVTAKMARMRRGMPVQHVLLGLNAHINFDLAIGLCSNILALGTANDRAKMARYRHDHDAVNDILEAALPEVMEVLSNRYSCPAARCMLRARRWLRKALYGVLLLMLRVWRTRVWRSMRTMLRSCDATFLLSRDARPLSRAEERMNRRAGLFAKVLGLSIHALW